MARLTDLISNARAGRSVKDLLGLNAKQLEHHSGEAEDGLLDQIAMVEATFFALAEDVQAAHLQLVLAELERIASDI